MIKAYFQSFGILTDAETDQCIEASHVRKLAKLDYFIREGEVCNEVGFVVSGMIRSFYLSATGEETTYCIIFPNNLLAAYSSFITGEPTRENMQAITPVELVLIPKKAILQLTRQSHNWMHFMKLMAEQQYIELEKRVAQLQQNTAAERYADMLVHQPEYIKHIPLHYLASYLGITQRHLSRIRSEMVF